MNLVRWEPFRELISLRQAMDRLFEESFVRPSRALALVGDGIQPPIDMYQTPSEVVVKTSVPGVKPEDVEVTITDDTLTIKGETKATDEVKREDYLYRERHYGSFTRSIALPHGLKSDKAQATTEDGTLTLTIPKAEDVKSRTIAIKAKGTTEGEKK